MVHDIVCSWCSISYHNSKGAIKNLHIDVNFRFLTFQLKLNMGEGDESIKAT